MIPTKRTSTGAALLASLTLAACGGGGPNIPDGPRGIYTSTSDCISGKLFDAKTCREAISEAIKKHREKAPKYEFVHICKGIESHCERSYANEFRPRLLGFLLQKSSDKDKEFEALPLYPPNTSLKGMRDLAGTAYLKTDFTIRYSSLSQKALEMFPNKSQVKKKGL